MKTYNLMADTENTWDDLEEDAEEKVEYEIISGNENIVFIKAGAGDSARGHYKDKYFQMAQRIHERMGATVICASNPAEPHEETDEETIRAVVSNQRLESFKLYLWGTSDGAYKTLNLAKRFPETEKWIGVNTSFITLSDLEEKLQDLPYVKKTIVLGSMDDDYDILFPAMKEKENNTLRTIVVEGADHRFTDMLPEFIQTIDWLGE